MAISSILMLLNVAKQKTSFSWLLIGGRITVDYVSIKDTVSPQLKKQNSCFVARRRKSRWKRNCVTPLIKIEAF
ncbi:MAG: hypothetical protein KAT65_30035 [Methanophagales archaeon]|nr:hypothetical protein [Methanophagales archaeon]